MSEGLRSDGRGQAFTLEGVIGSVIILTAVVFALQSVVVTPTTSGDTSPQTQAQLSSEADGLLTVAKRTDGFDLSTAIRYWSHTDRQYYGSVNARIGYGEQDPPKALGRLLDETYDARGRTYNLYLLYPSSNVSNGTERLNLVYRGEPGAGAVTATTRVTLFDDMTLTAPGSRGIHLDEIGSNATDSRGGYYPIPDAVDGHVYNHVEVRVVVW